MLGRERHAPVPVVANTLCLDGSVKAFNVGIVVGAMEPTVSGVYACFGHLLVAFTVQGFLVWQHAIAGFIGGSIGSYIGTKYAIKKGETFAKYALAIMSLIGATALLL